MSGPAEGRVGDGPGERDAPLPAIGGPTATGKTETAIAVARRIDGEIVSVDSRQAYRGMEIGTAAPSAEERERVPHHGVAFLDPGERYGAGTFSRLAREWIGEIRARGRVPILAGGTGLFVSALTDPVFREPEMGRARRARLRAWAEDQRLERLRRWVRRLDPGLEERIGTLDRQRCSRTLELALLSGRPLLWWQEHGEPEAPPVPVRHFVLELPPGHHRRAIRERTERQLDEGWPEEVRRLLGAGGGRGDPGLSAVGYRTVASLLRGEIDREEAVERIVRDTWAYARRQRTWFRHQVPVTAVRLDARRPAAELAERVVREWRAGRRDAPAEEGAR